MGRCYDLGKVAGIRFVAHGSFFLLLAGLAVTADPDGFGGTGWLLGQTLLCVLLHELGHGAAARLNGQRVRKVVLIPLLGHPLPDNPPRTTGAQLLFHLAGPGLNLLVAAGLLAALPAQPLPDLLLSPPAPAEPAKALLTVNLWLGLVNLLPVLPTDAGRFLRHMLTPSLGLRRATDCLALPGQVLGIGLIAGGAFGPWFLVLLGLLLLFGGQFEREASQAAEWLEGAWVLDATDTRFLLLDGETTAGQAAAQFAAHPACRYGIVRSDAGVSGVVPASLARSLGAISPRLPVRHLMQTDVAAISAQSPLSPVCGTLTWLQGTIYLVTQKDTIVGVLGPDTLFRLVTLAVEQEPVPRLFQPIQP